MSSYRRPVGVPPPSVDSLAGEGAVYDFDMITIGGGSAGVSGSRRAAEYGCRVAVVEESRVGGTCVLRGCVPKKLLVYASHIREDMHDARGYGFDGEPMQLDWGRLIEAKEVELNRLEGVYKGLLERSGVTMLYGRGTIVDAHTVAVGDRRYTAKVIKIAVGGWPSLPPGIPGIQHAITSNEALCLGRLPDSVVIVGGGYIAVEFAGIFNGCGVPDVEVVIRKDKVLFGFDEDVRDFLGEEMKKKGIQIRPNSQVREIILNSDGSKTVAFMDGSSKTVGEVLYATGRTPMSANLGLENVPGVQVDPRSGAIRVNEWSQTGVPSIFAVGDVTDRVNLTPVAIKEGRGLAETLWNNNPMSPDHDDVPLAVFSNPPIGACGLTEEEAAQRFARVHIYKSDFRAMKHTLGGRQERTLMKLIVDGLTDRVLGCHMVGADAPEIVQGLGVAIKCGATKAHFDATVGIHPTAAEEFVTMRGIARTVGTQVASKM